MPAHLAAWAQSDDDPLRQLHPAHPRLILLDSDLDRLRGSIRDNPLAHRIYLDLEKESERLLTAPPSEYKLSGRACALSAAGFSTAYPRWL